MKFALEMSVSGSAAEPAGVIAIAQALEAAGFDALAFTDHPAPSRKWLGEGPPSHPTYDPFSALAFCAAVTTTIRLMTWLAVLPYRNPLLTLKCVATVDRLSTGRLTLVAGAGYLRSEFAALGRPFDRRKELTEETLQVLRAYRPGEPTAFKGHDFEALDQVCVPSPAQAPLPIWIGGNGTAAMEWVVKYGNGWGPLLMTEERARPLGSRGIPTLDDLEIQLKRLHSMAEAKGRDPSTISLCIPGGELASALDRPGDHMRQLDRMRELGATHVMMSARRGEVDDILGMVARYAAGVIRPDQRR